MTKHFDELAKAFAAGVPRRVALRRFAGGLVGAAMATVIPGQTALAAGGKADCAAWCEARNEVGPKLAPCIHWCVNQCVTLCDEMYSDDALDRAQCIGRSQQCPPGQCAPFVDNDVHNVCLHF